MKVIDEWYEEKYPDYATFLKSRCSVCTHFEEPGRCKISGERLSDIEVPTGCLLWHEAGERRTRDE